MGDNSVSTSGGESHKVTELAILKEAVENANEGFVTIDEHHTVLFFNNTAERIFGFSREEVIGRDLNTILSPRCSQDHRLAVARYIKTKEPKLIGHETEFAAVRKSGETFPAAISFSVAEIAGNLFFTALVRDLTETKALQQKTLRSERLAALGQLVAEITHEIKNPLTIIGGFIRQLKRSISGEKELGKLDIIAQETERLESLLLELREFYLPKSLQIEHLDINEVVKEVHRLVKDDCERKRIQTTVNTEVSGGFVASDREKLKQVLLNLVKNAIEAIGTDGTLWLQTEKANDTIKVTVADDGPGVSKDAQKKVFDPFFTTKKHGSGLGLSICKSIIEEHRDCSLDLVSEEGKGTAVMVTFPFVSSKGDNHETDRDC